MKTEVFTKTGEPVYKLVTRTIYENREEVYESLVTEGSFRRDTESATHVKIGPDGIMDYATQKKIHGYTEEMQSVALEKCNYGCLYILVVLGDNMVGNLFFAEKIVRKEYELHSLRLASL